MNTTLNMAKFEADIVNADARVVAEKTAVAAVGADANHKPIWWSTQNAMTISAAVLIFGAVVIAVAARSTPADTSLETRLRLYGTIMVITMAAFLVVTGYNDSQIAAPLGLLGTIAGYLLGQRSAPPVPGMSRPPASPPAKSDGG